VEDLEVIRFQLLSDFSDLQDCLGFIGSYEMFTLSSLRAMWGLMMPIV